MLLRMRRGFRQRYLHGMVLLWEVIAMRHRQLSCPVVYGGIGQ